MKFACVFALFVTFVATNECMGMRFFSKSDEDEVIDIKNFSEWRERLIKLADELEKKLKEKDPNVSNSIDRLNSYSFEFSSHLQTEPFDNLRKQFDELDNENFGIVHELTLLQLGREEGKQVQCRFNNNNFNCLSL